MILQVLLSVTMRERIQGYVIVDAMMRFSGENTGLSTPEPTRSQATGLSGPGFPQYESQPLSSRQPNAGPIPPAV